MKPEIVAATFPFYPIESKPIYVDSACSCHLMADVKYLRPNHNFESL